MDLLAKLYGFDLEERLTAALERVRGHGIQIKRAAIVDKDEIVRFVAEEFTDEDVWVHECEYALLHDPISCYIATYDKNIIGFACYDATAKGFFGPTGVRRDFRGKGAGAALLLKCLAAMKEQGYGYAVIGWVSDADKFYRIVADAIEIPDSPPEKSVYQNMISFG